MRPAAFFAAAAALVGAHAANSSAQLSAKLSLPATFTPPPVFRHVNFIRNVNLEKGYVSEKIDFFLQNIGTEPQDQYYLSFPAEVMPYVGGVEGRDKQKNLNVTAEAVEFDPSSPIQYWQITLAEPIPPKTDTAISLKYHILNSLSPLPANIDMASKQYLQYQTSAYVPSAYLTSKQTLKIKFPNSDVPDYTKVKSKSGEDPQRQGSSFTYGPYEDIEAGKLEPISVRYEFTKPVIHATLLEHDTEVSHWGGNLASEERLMLENAGAALTSQFSRLEWQMAQYTNPPLAALKDLRFALSPGAANAYYTDDIGNVSTSRFVPWMRLGEDNIIALLDAKPRYPLFGGWKYKFRIGWDNDLAAFLRRTVGGEGYVLKVPFMAGLRMPEGASYDRVVSTIMLPEGATDVQWSTSIPLVDAQLDVHKTFMDTIGRTSLQLTAVNLIDEFREREVIVSAAPI
jgi:oligosaccharyltransferase complex subunit alpha (ribophorin I)